MRRPTDQAFEYLLENLETYAGSQTGRFVYNEFLELLAQKYSLAGDKEIWEGHLKRFIQRQRVE